MSLAFSWRCRLQLNGDEVFLYVIFMVVMVFLLPFQSFSHPSVEVYPLKSQTGTTYRQKGEDLEKNFSLTPGFFLNSAGSMGQMSSGNIRGMNGVYTAVLIEGGSFYDGRSGTTDLSKISSLGIDQTIRSHGPDVLLYAPQAVSVLDLRTTNPLKKTTIGGEAGSFNTVKGFLKSTIVQDSAQHIILGNHSETGGLPQYGSFRVYGEKNRYRQENGGVLSTIALGGRTTLQTQVRVLESLLKYDQGQPPLPLKPQGTQENKDMILGANFSHETLGGIRHQISLSHVGQETVYEREEGPCGKETRVSYHQDIPWSSIHRTRFVLEGTDHSLKQKTQPKSHRSIAGGAVLHSVNLDSDWQTDFGMRQDYTQHYTQNPLGTVGVSWQKNGTRLYGSWRQGYRLPTLYDIRAESPFFQPNPTLKPERMDFSELGWHQKIKDKTSVQLVYFYNQLRQKIVGIPLGFTRSTVGNLPGKTIVKGSEVSLVYLCSDTLSLKGAYTYTESNQRLESPKHQASITLIQANGSWEIESTLSYIGNRRDWSQKNLPFYRVHHLAITYKLTDQWRLYGEVKNLWDERYEVVSGYRSPRRAFYAGTSFTF